jgi:hypothetical protein
VGYDRDKITHLLHGGTKKEDHGEPRAYYFLPGFLLGIANSPEASAFLLVAFGAIAFVDA